MIQQPKAKDNPQDARRATIERTLAALATPGDVIELRALFADGRIASGYFDDHAKLIDAAIKLDGQNPEGIYITLQQVNPVLLARAANRVRDKMPRKATATADKDILRYRFFPIDCDQVRPSGISASDAELQIAVERAGKICEYLTGAGWPMPLSGLSGNGAHLVYRIDLPNDKDSTELVENCIKALDARFTDELAKVDTTVFNPARIWKLYGTMARKGDSTPDRPHRRSTIMHAPDTMICVTVDQLKALAALKPTDEKTSNERTKTTGNERTPRNVDGAYWKAGSADAVESWAAGHGITLERKDNGWKVDCLTCNGAHTDGAWLTLTDNGYLRYKCHHDSCSNAKISDVLAKYPAPTASAKGPAGAHTNTASAPTGDDLLSEKIEADLIEWGFRFSMSELDDLVLCNGQPITDAMAALIRMEARDSKRYGGKGKIALAALEDGYTSQAHRHRFHPVKDYLNGLQWDGQDHFWRLNAHFKDSHDPIVYKDKRKVPVFAAWLWRWMAGVVAKVFSEAGPIRVQTPVLVLAGAQGAGKSTFAAWLASPLPDLFIESPVEPENKEHDRLLATRWIWEISELGATTRRKDRELLKSFFTRGDVTFRKPWGRHAIRKPALASFIGTLNPESGFLVDPTGNRRFLTVELTDINHAYAKTVDVNQVWAQVMDAYRKAPHVWLLSAEEIAKRDGVNQENEVERPFQGAIATFFHIDRDPETASWITTPDIIAHLHRNGVRFDETLHHGVLGATLRGMGLERKQRRISGEQVWGYRGLKERKISEAVVDDTEAAGV